MMEMEPEPLSSLNDSRLSNMTTATDDTRSNSSSCASSSKQSAVSSQQQSSQSRTLQDNAKKKKKSSDKDEVYQLVSLVRLLIEKERKDRTIAMEQLTKWKKLALQEPDKAPEETPERFQSSEHDESSTEHHSNVKEVTEEETPLDDNQKKNPSVAEATCDPPFQDDGVEVSVEDYRASLLPPSMETVEPDDEDDDEEEESSSVGSSEASFDDDDDEVSTILETTFDLLLEHMSRDQSAKRTYSKRTSKRVQERLRAAVESRRRRRRHSDDGWEDDASSFSSRRRRRRSSKPSKREEDNVWNRLKKTFGFASSSSSSSHSDVGGSFSFDQAETLATELVAEFWDLVEGNQTTASTPTLETMCSFGDCMEPEVRPYDDDRDEDSAALEELPSSIGLSLSPSDETSPNPEPSNQQDMALTREEEDPSSKVMLTQQELLNDSTEGAWDRLECTASDLERTTAKTKSTPSMPPKLDNDDKPSSHTNVEINERRRRKMQRMLERRATRRNKAAVEQTPNNDVAANSFHQPTESLKNVSEEAGPTQSTDSWTSPPSSSSNDKDHSRRPVSNSFEAKRSNIEVQPSVSWKHPLSRNQPLETVHEENHPDLAWDLDTDFGNSKCSAISQESPFAGLEDISQEDDKWHIFLGSSFETPTFDDNTFAPVKDSSIAPVKDSSFPDAGIETGFLEMAQEEGMVPTTATSQPADKPVSMLVSENSDPVFITVHPTMNDDAKTETPKTTQAANQLYSVPIPDCEPMPSPSKSSEASMDGVTWRWKFFDTRAKTVLSPSSVTQVPAIERTYTQSTKDFEDF